MTYPPPGFGAPPLGPAPGGLPPSGGEPPNHTASLVAAFGLSAASFFCCGLFFVLPLVFAIIAAVQAGSGHHDGARTMARTSTIIGGVMIAIGALVWIAYIAMMLIGQTQ